MILDEFEVVHFSNHQFRLMYKLALDIGEEVAESVIEKRWITNFKNREQESEPPDEDWCIEEGFEAKELLFWSKVFEEVAIRLHRNEEVFYKDDHSSKAQVYGIHIFIALSLMFEKCANRKLSS